MRIVITMDDSLTVAAHVEDAEDLDTALLSAARDLALRDLAVLAGERRNALLGKGDPP